jgi:exportin-5
MKMKESLMNLLESCLDCLSNYVDWINIGFVLSRNYSLINISLLLLKNERLCLSSARCLIALVDRKGPVADRQPLLGLFSDSSLNQIFDCIKMSLKDYDESSQFKKDLLKSLVQILVGMGMQLNAQWNESDFVPPQQFNVYLSAIYEFTVSENKIYSSEAIHLWNILLANEFIRTNEQVKLCMMSLITAMTNSYFLFKVTATPEIIIAYDFDSEDDFFKFYQKYRTELAKLIKTASNLYLNQFMEAAYAWAKSTMEQTISQPNTNDRDNSGYDTKCFKFLSWDALVYLWSTLMSVINNKIKLNQYQDVNQFELIKQILYSLIDLAIKFESTNANYCSLNLSLLSSILVVCSFTKDNNNEANKKMLLTTILKKLFESFKNFQAEFQSIEQSYPQDKSI